MSMGSVPRPVSIVSVTMPCETETTLTVFETWLATQTSSSLREFTETGPTPTGISAISDGFVGRVTSKTDNDAFSLFTAKSRVVSADRRTGLVCAGSKLAKGVGVRLAMVRAVKILLARAIEVRARNKATNGRERFALIATPPHRKVPNRTPKTHTEGRSQGFMPRAARG